MSIAHASYEQLRHDFRIASAKVEPQRPEMTLAECVRSLLELYEQMERNDRELNAAFERISDEQYVELETLGRFTLAQAVWLSRWALSLSRDAVETVDADELGELREQTDYWAGALEDEYDHPNLARLYETAVAEFGTDALEDGGFAR